jgi:hypothetical protein
VVAMLHVASRFGCPATAGVTQTAPIPVSRIVPGSSGSAIEGMAKYRYDMLAPQNNDLASIYTLVNAFVVFDPRSLRRCAYLAACTDPGGYHNDPGCYLGMLV